MRKYLGIFKLNCPSLRFWQRWTIMLPVSRVDVPHKAFYCSSEKLRGSIYFNEPEHRNVSLSSMQKKQTMLPFIQSFSLNEKKNIYKHSSLVIDMHWNMTFIISFLCTNEHLLSFRSSFLLHKVMPLLTGHLNHLSTEETRWTSSLLNSQHVFMCFFGEIQWSVFGLVLDQFEVCSYCVLRFH